MKSRDGKSQRREEKRREEDRRSIKRKSKKKEDPGAREGRKAEKHCVCPMICGSGGSKSRLAKAAGAEPAGQMRDEKLHAVVAQSAFQSQKCKKLSGMSFRVAGARDCATCQKWAKLEGFVAFPRMMAGVGRLKRICTDAFSVAGALQETCSSELLGGPGSDFLRRVPFWSIRSSVLGVTGAALRLTWHLPFVAGAVL